MTQLPADNYKGKSVQFVNIVGIVFVILGSVGHFFEHQNFKYVFGAGALFVIFSQLKVMFETRNPDFKQRRLLRMNLMLSLLLALATYSMFEGTTMWIAVVLIFALVTLFMSFRS